MPPFSENIFIKITIHSPNRGLSDCLKSVSDGKKSVASAITAQGVSTAADAEFTTIAANITAAGNARYNTGYNNGYSAGYNNKVATHTSSAIGKGSAVSITINQNSTCLVSCSFQASLVAVTLNGVNIPMTNIAAYGSGLGLCIGKFNVQAGNVLTIRNLSSSTTVGYSVSY